jgi:hypothetical protein
MEQERTVNKALLTLKLMRLIKEENSSHVRSILGQIYTAGWEERGKTLVGHNRKKVVMCDCKGKELREFASILSAIKIMNVSRKTIFPALAAGKPTYNGYIWKYKK